MRLVGTVLLVLLPSIFAGSAAFAGSDAARPRERSESEARTGTAWSSSDDASRDTIFNVAAAVPRPGIVRASVGGGGDRSRADGKLGGSYGAGLLWSMGAGVATEVTVNARDGGALPAVGLRWQWLEQSRAGIDVMTAARYGTFGTELPSVSGGQLGAQLAMSRSFGPVQLTVNGLIARGVNAREGLDAIVGAAALVDVVRASWRIGVDARARAEVEDRYRTVEDEGRTVEIAVGAVSGHRYGPVYIQVLGGWQAPRGLANPGPVALASMSVDF